MPRRTKIKGLKQFSDCKLRIPTRSETLDQRGEQTTSYESVVITGSHHQVLDSLEFCPPTLQWQQELCQRLACRVQPKAVRYVQQQSRLTGNDFVIRDVRGDGNCLFRALAFVVTGDEEHHMMIRRGLVAYMRQHKNNAKHYIILEPRGNNFLDRNFENQMREMEKDGTWGTQAEIIAAASMFQTNIHMYQHRHTKSGVLGEWNTYRADMLLQCCPNQQKCSMYLNHTGAHYNVVLGNQKTKPGQSMPPLVSGSKRPRIDNSTDVLTANNSGLQFECDRNNTPGNKDLKNCHSCGKSFKNLKLHLTKKPACKNVYDFSIIEAESDLRIKTRQTVYKEKNRSQINVKKKEYRELKRDKITEYNSANKEKIRKNQEIYNRENKDKVRSRQEKYNRENKDEV